MKNRKNGRIGNMGIKLNIFKAHDRDEWSILKIIIIKLGFGQRWVDLIIKCISLVHYSILVNCQPRQKIIPTKGLRQENPLSPYLFFLCGEDLSSLVNYYEVVGYI